MPFDPSALVTLSGAPLMLSGGVDAEVERLWQAEQTRRGNRLFNGKILSAIEVASDGILARIVEYRHLIAQRDNPDLFEALNVRPVAVSGLLECPEGILFGRRAAMTTQHAGLWELCPSGGLEMSAFVRDGAVDYRAQILAELREEIGVVAGAVSDVNPFCVVEDLASHVVDIGIELHSTLSALQLRMLHHNSATKEYDELLIVRRENIVEFMASSRLQLVDVSATLIEYSRTI